MKVNISRNTVERWRTVDYRGRDTIDCKDILCYGYDACDNCLFETNASKIAELIRIKRIQETK